MNSFICFISLISLISLIISVSNSCQLLKEKEYLENRRLDSCSFNSHIYNNSDKFKLVTDKINEIERRLPFGNYSLADASDISSIDFRMEEIIKEVSEIKNIIYEKNFVIQKMDN